AGVSTKLKTAGEDVAKIMFVVGSNQRLAHPQWQQNQDFSQDLADLLETMAPDIIRGVRVSASRYNQHISTKAMLVEIGSTENTVEEAQRSAALLGEALAQLLAKDV
ncbi:MAG: stage II sporulation protein P, partial [Clostridiales bacterium]